MRLLKPSNYQRLVRKNTKRLAKARAKRLRQQQDRFEWDLVRAAVFHRAQGRCQVTGVRLMLHSPDVLSVGHAHHLKYSSAGGTDDLSNLILVSPAVHEAEHNHVIKIEGTAEYFTVSILPGYPEGYQPVIDAIRAYTKVLEVA